MPKPIYYRTPNSKDPQLLVSLIALIRRELPIHLQNTRITREEAYTLLCYAAVNHTSLEGACAELADAPSGNRLREVLLPALPTRLQLQRHINTILGRQLPPSVRNGKRAYALAIDLTLIPYHGQPAHDTNEIVRSAAKSGTTHFHGYASVSIVHHRQRYVVAYCFVTAGETMVAIVRRLLDRVRKLGLRVRCVFLDKGFYAGEVFRTLARRRLSYVIPLRVGQKHDLYHRRGSARTTHTLTHARGGAYTVQVRLIRRYKQDHQGHRKVWWLGYAVGGWACRLSLHQVREWYRCRFGIETSYRQMHQVRARTSSTNPVLRLLFIGLAFILVNLYVALRQCVAIRRRRATQQRVRPVAFRCLIFKLRHEIERLLGTRAVKLYRYSLSVS
jgi:hypothetical protein